MRHEAELSVRICAQFGRFMGLVLYKQLRVSFRLDKLCSTPKVEMHISRQTALAVVALPMLAAATPLVARQSLVAIECCALDIDVSILTHVVPLDDFDHARSFLTHSILVWCPLSCLPWV